MKQIRALERGLAVLDSVTRAGPSSLQALAEETELPKATLLRILLTLEAAGYVRRGLGDRLWRANVRTGPLQGNRQEIILAEVTGPVLDRLCQEILWPSDIGVYIGGTIRVLETSRRMSPFVVNRDVLTSRVHVMPSAMGRAILAWSNEAERARIISDLSRTDDPQDVPARDPLRVAALIAETRAQDYATRSPSYYVRERREAAMRAIAVPVIAGTRVIGAINLTWIHSAEPEAAFIRRHLNRLQQAAAEIADAFVARAEGS